MRVCLCVCVCGCVHVCVCMHVCLCLCVQEWYIMLLCINICDLFCELSNFLVLNVTSHVLCWFCIKSWALVSQVKEKTIFYATWVLKVQESPFITHSMLVIHGVAKYFIGGTMLKGVSGHMRTVWSGPSPYTNRTIGHYKIYQCRTNACMRRCACVGWIWIWAFCPR